MGKMLRIIKVKELARVIGVSDYIMGRYLRHRERIKGRKDVLTLSPNPAPNSYRYVSTADAIDIATLILKDKFSSGVKSAIYRHARDLVR